MGCSIMSNIEENKLKEKEECTKEIIPLSNRYIPDTKFGTTYIIRFIIPRNFEKIYKIIIKIVYRNNIRVIYVWVYLHLRHQFHNNNNLY